MIIYTLLFNLVSLRQREEDKEENRLSEEAERTFDHLQSQEDEDEPIGASERAGAPASRLDVTYLIEDENQVPPSTIRVPALVTAT